MLDKHSQVGADPLWANHTPWETDKLREEIAQISSELYRKGTSDVCVAPTEIFNSAPTAEFEESFLVEERFMEIDSLPIRRSNLDSTFMEGPLEEIEWSVVPAGNPRNRGIHIIERYVLGCRLWPQQQLCFM
ncbi:hypothetical protein AYI70_g6869 [Smittium culicis]|uniref:Uncharacterized protein n=1 Tax=Smittium culicis TaxID=133412 RepID=A0A1R1XN06_9FUNG|nr:hypothetical protein AYI70_g6869 [Smittium culicis]